MDLQNVFWVGGSPCTGKTTVTDKLRSERPIQVFHTDDIFVSAQATVKRQPHMYELNQMENPLLIWNRSAGECLTFWLQYYEEAFDLLLDQLVGQMEPEEPLIMEGICLMPEFLYKHGLLRRSLFIVCTQTVLKAAVSEKFDFIKNLDMLENRERIYQNIVTTFASTATLVYDTAKKYGCPVRVIRQKGDYSENFSALSEWLQKYSAQPRP